jgi:hypothetical protein
MSEGDAMTRPRLYTTQLVVLVRHVVGERIKVVRKRSGLSQAEVIRRAIDYGLPQVEDETARQAAADQAALAS